ncbi:hypothetical protein IGI39_004335 [Enterococcus sp. AZ135]|uniref:helix-turn-helix domain-containing protein n=1 Tax=unclassified Enterococcus TaxID=2608891 RepID=UPI003F28D710
MDFRQALGVSNRRRLRLIEILYYNREGTPSEKLTSELGCSLPILLSDISLINAQQEKFFIVEKDKGLYRVKLMEDISIGKLYAEALTSAPEFQLIEQLLYEKYDNIGEVSKSLFLSSSNTQRYLKKVEAPLRQAGIDLCYRPLRLEGKESIIRHFFYRYFLEKQYALRSILPNLKEYQLRSIERFVQEFITINNLYKKHIFQKRLTYNVFISLWRIKNGHDFPKEDLRTDGLLLPKNEAANAFRDMVSEVYQLDLTEDMMRDCLWLSFSDSVVFSKEHLALALDDNPRYRQLFEKHLTLTREFTKLLGGSIDEERIQELTSVLLNDSYLYDENGEFLTILRKNRTIFLEMVKIMHRHAVEKVTEIAKDFVQKYEIYQNEDFITNYVYLLLTAEVDSLERLASQDKTIHLLLTSDLSPTEEEFIAKVIKQIVYGNFEIGHLGSVWDNDEEVNKKIVTYDGLITTGSREGLPKDFPLVSMDPYVTPQSIVAIQNLVNELSEKMFRGSTLKE